MKESKRRGQMTQRRIGAHLEQVDLFAAGVDIGSRSHDVAVPEELDRDPVREFAVFHG